MNKKLIRKFLINALNELNERYRNDCCNDLIPGDSLLEDVSKTELVQIEKQWRKFFPSEAKECDGEMGFNTQLVRTLIELLENS